MMHHLIKGYLSLNTLRLIDPCYGEELIYLLTLNPSLLQIVNFGRWKMGKVCLVNNE